MYACMYVCMYVSMYLCIYVCIYVCMHACLSGKNQKWSQHEDGSISNDDNGKCLDVYEFIGWVCECVCVRVSVL